MSTIKTNIMTPRVKIQIVVVPATKSFPDIKNYRGKDGVMKTIESIEDAKIAIEQFVHSDTRGYANYWANEVSKCIIVKRTIIEEIL